MDTFTKQPEETIDYTVDFSQALKAGDTLAATAPTVAIVNMVIPAPSGDVLPTLGTATVNTGAGAIVQRISGGTNGQTYLYTCIATTTSGEVLEHNFKLRIRDI